MPFYMYAWLASVSYGFYQIVAKLVGKYTLTNVWQFSFFSLFFGAVVTSGIALTQGAGMPESWGYILLAALFFAAGGALYLIALKHLDVSVMAPLFNIRVVITVILGVFFLGEVLSVRGIWLVGLVVVAGFFATMDEKFSLKSFFTRNVFMGLLFMLVLSVQSVFINRAIDQTGYWTATLWIGILATLFGLVFLYPKFKKELRETKPVKYVGGGSVIGNWGSGRFGGV